MLALIYNTSQLKPLSGFNVNIAMTIVVAQDGSSYRFPKQFIYTQEVATYNDTRTATLTVSSQPNPLYAVAVNETINGNLGVATPGDLNWWVKGVHFEIAANLPTSALVESQIQ